jgi:hypothetical protein
MRLSGVSMSALISCMLFTISLLSSTVGCTSGCVVSNYPLSAEDASTLDRQLIGTWEIVEENPTKEPGGSLVENKPFFIEAKPASKSTLLVKSPDPKEKGQPLEVINTELGRRRYLSVKGLEEKHQDEWGIFQYEWLDEDSFRIRAMDPHVLAEEVKAKRVSGRISERGKRRIDNDEKQVVITDVQLEEPTDKLRKYVEKRGDKLFEKHWVTFRRIKPK